MGDEVVAVVRASAARRGLGLAMLGLLGVLLIYVALVRPPAASGWQAFLLLAGLFSLWAGDRMRRATALTVELTPAGLRSSDGEVIATLDRIEAVDRGMFAFKPSNGFLLRLTGPAGARWQPGLWWRVGRRVGIGGVTPASQAKVMADLLAAMLAERDGPARGD